VVGVQAIANGTVSTLGIPAANPAGNADTIANALGPYPNNSAKEFIRTAASTGFFVYNEPSCGGVGGSRSAPSIGTALGSAALGSVPVVGGTLQKLFGLFTGHHTAAVKTEQATLCQAVPDATNFLRAVYQMIAPGQLDVSSAPDVLEQGFQNWLGEVGAIIKDSGKKCNAACIYKKAFRAAIEKRKIDYAYIAVQNTRGASGIVGGVVNAATGVVGSIENALASVFGGGSPASVPGVLPPGSLVQAGMGPNNLTGFALIGGFLVVAILGFQILSGGRNEH